MCLQKLIVSLSIQEMYQLMKRDVHHRDIKTTQVNHVLSESIPLHSDSEK